MNAQPTDSYLTTSDKEGIKLDYKRVVYRALRFWYLVVISVTLAVTLAFIYNRYAARIYPVTASIIIKEKEETAGNELLYSNGLIDPYRNYLNELYIIRSYPMIQSVITELNFGVTFVREGNVLTSELYDYPVYAKVMNTDAIKICSVIFQPLNQGEFSLAPIEAEGDQQASVFNFNDTILYKGVKVVFKIRNPTRLPEHLNSPIRFNYIAPEYLTGEYVGKLSSTWAEEGSGVINLSVNGVNPAKEIDFINGLIRRYQQYDLENKNEMATRTIDFINSQLLEISDSLRQVENVLKSFKGQNTITDLNVETNRLYLQLEGVESGHTDLLVRQNYYKYLEDYIRKDSNLDQVILPSSVGITDNVLNEFISEMIQIQLDLKFRSGSDKLTNPLLAQQEGRLQQIKANILEAVKNQRGTDAILQKAIASRAKRIENQLGGLPEAERQYVSIKRNYSLLENLYVYLLQKRAEASISRAASISDIVMVNPPMSGGPVSPKPAQNYVIAVAAGIALPLFIFILLEILNTRIQSKEDVEKFTSIPFIGGVGHKTSTNNLTVLASPKSAVAESFRALRSNLNYFLGERKNAVILVTSSISGEGKTFTTINLAAVLALSGKRTLIVGADLRKPKLFADFELNNEIGLSSFLVGFSTFDQVLQKTKQEHLDLISGGPVPPNPSELILGLRMEEFVKEARSRYDYVIIDSPPLAIVADAFVLKDLADHLIFVTRQDYTPKNMLKSLDDHYRSGRLKNISLLLNDIYKSGPGYGYGYGYNYGYGYGYLYGKRKNGDGYYSE